MIHLALLLALLCSPGMERTLASPGPPRVLHFTRYSSPSGEYVLEVDPSSRSGAGPGKYRLLRGEDEVWAKELPVTMWEAAVSDLGHVGGHAYSAGADSMRGSFHVLILSPAGDVVRDEAVERGFGRSPDSTAPTGGDPVAHAELDRFVLRIWALEEHGGNRWAAYRLSTGEALAPVTPAPIAGEEEALGSPTVHALPGTDLFLVHWLHRVHRPDIDRNHWDRGAIFSVMDAAGTSVWHHTLRGDYNLPGSMKETRAFERLVEWHGLIHGRGEPGRFSLWFVKERQLVDFAVHRDASAKHGWTVAEIGRKDYDPPLEPARPSAPAIHLSLLGTVKLEAPAGAALDPGAATIDHHGRVLFQDQTTRRVHVHDSDGKRLFVCEPGRNDVRGDPARGGITAGPDGSVWVPVESRSKQFVRFDAAGTRLYLKVMGATVVLFSADKRRYWAANRSGLRLIDLQGNVHTRSERRIDRRWFCNVSRCTTSPDGAPVLVEDTLRFEPATLVVFDTKGVPRESFVLPEGRARNIASSGTWVALEVEGGTFHLLRTGDGAFFSFFPELHLLEKPNWVPGFSPDGRELWLFDGTTRCLHRFALPE